MVLHKAILWLLVYFIQDLRTDDDCMIWDILGDNLMFSCTITDFSNPVTLFDNQNKTSAKCSFEKDKYQTIRCAHQIHNVVLGVNVKNKEVMFTIPNIKSKYVDGAWSCLQGLRTSTCKVSKLKGIVSDTDIFLQGEVLKINKTSHISLLCSSCRESRGKYIEFLINGRSEISITYNPVTGKCTHQTGECSQKRCYCESTKNEFVAIFSFNADTETLFSCEMQFIDEETSMLFSKTANIRFNGTDFQVMKTDTNILLHPKAPNKDTDVQSENVTTLSTIQDDTDEIDKGGVARLVLVSSLSTIIVVVLITVIFVCLRQQQRKGDVSKNYRNQFNIDDEDTQLVVKSESGLNQANDVEDTAPKYVPEHALIKTDTGTSMEKGLIVSLTEVGTCTEKEPVVSRIEASTSMENASQGCDSVETMTEKSYLDTVEKNKKIEDMIKSGEIKRCFLCSVREKMKSALYWCLDCGNGFCIKCRDMHQALTHHTIVEIKKIPKTYRPSICCPQHKQLGLDYFCIDHHELCCLKCRLIDHASCHKTEYIDVVSKAYSQSQACRDFDYKLHICSGVLTILNVLVECNIASIEKDCDRIQHNILSSRENETAEDDNTRKLNTDLKKTKANCLSTLQNYISKTEIMEASTEKLKLLFEFFLENGSNKSLFRFIHSTKHNLNDINAKIQTLSEQIIRLSVHYVGYEEGNPASGRIVISERKHGVFTEENRRETGVQIPIASSTVSFEGEFEISSEKIQGGMAVSHNGSLLVCDTIHQSLVVIVENEQHASIKLSYTPEDISVIPDIDTAVLTCRTDIIQFVDISKRTMLGTKEVEDSAACSVACTSEYILIGSKLKIVMLDHEGTLITNIETDCSIRKLSYFKKKIYFTEYGSNKVRCIEINGEKVFCHQTKNVSAPICAVPNAEDHVYILDKGPIKLHKLSTYGQSIRLEIKDKVNLKNPKSMCFNKDYTKLYVLNNGGSSICTLRIKM